MLTEFRRRFWQPPRAHGEVIEGRTVSFLELFYDLVYVVVISRAAHTLAEDISWRGFGNFTAVFALIWVAWLNGTAYYELHGREDGRTRGYVFGQMFLLALLAVFTAEAAGETGAEFAVVYTLYLLLLTWMWYEVRRQDSPEYSVSTARYISGMLIASVVMAVSAVMDADARVLVWGGLVIIWLGGMGAMSRAGDITASLRPTESMVERHGLFVIIVLGEVVVGVVTGLSEAERSFTVIATGMLGLVVGFAYWWSYFDFVGRRSPKGDTLSLMTWITSHLPVTLSIAAGGAAMVGLIEHASDTSTPAATAWLLTGSLAIGLVSLGVRMRTLEAFDEFPTIYAPISIGTALAAGAALIIGWVAPAPWLLLTLLIIALSTIWVFAMSRWLRLDDPEHAIAD